MKVEIVAKCAVCDTNLEIDTVTKLVIGFDFEYCVVVQPCEFCIETAQKNIVEDSYHVANEEDMEYEF